MEQESNREGFGICSTGLELLAKGDNRLGPHFDGQMDRKEGWSIDQCTHEVLARVLKFLIPIFHHEKQRKVIVRLGSTIVESLIEQRSVDWALIMHEVLFRQVANI